MLRGAIDVECKPSSKHLAGEIKNKDDLLTLGPFVETLVAGPTMSIIKSFLVLGRLVARANLSVASGGNGRQATQVDRHTRLTAAPRERPGCSPASPPPEGTFCPSSRSADGAVRAETVGHDRAIQTAGLLYTYILCKRWLLGGLPSAWGLFRREPMDYMYTDNEIAAAVREHDDLKDLEHGVYFGNPDHPSITDTLAEVDDESQEREEY